MKPSPLLKAFSIRALVQSILFSIILFAIAACFYWRSRTPGLPVDMTDMGALFVFIVCFGILQWLFQKNVLAKLTAEQPATPLAVKTVKARPQDTEEDRKKRLNQDKRLFVHLFSVLQRQGRFMDFLQEDLSVYEDDQIGAAARSIHESCKKTVGRYLAPEPVMKQAEGETVEIAQGFDQHAVKLVGNVVGEPPFSGILRHRGWQLRSISLPKLSETVNPNIIAPAEVEIK